MQSAADSAEVPNLFPNDEIDRVIADTRRGACVLPALVAPSAPQSEEHCFIHRSTRGKGRSQLARTSPRLFWLSSLKDAELSLAFHSEARPRAKEMGRSEVRSTDN